MKKFFLCFLLYISASINNNCLAQNVDSIKYENGYLYYHTYGAQNLPPLILLTGGPGNSYNQLEVMAKTMSHKFRCILPEQRGTGKSIPTPFDSTSISVYLLTKDIKTLIDKLHLQNPVIIGHSWGGTLALSFASEFPKLSNHLILIAPGPHKDARRGFEVLFSNRTHTRSFAEEQRLIQLNERIKNNQADASEILESKKLARRAYIFANPVPDSIFNLINADRNSISEAVLLQDLFRNFDVSASLNRYKGRIDIISGRQDVVGFFSYEIKIDRPSASLHWINNCGHFPMYEKPNEFYKILYSILNAQ
jgi:proline iminopeptidase